MKSQTTKILLSILLILVVGIAGGYLIKSHMDNQKQLDQADKLKREELVRVSAELKIYYRRSGALPENLEVFRHNATVTYSRESLKTYQLCETAFNGDFKALLDEYDAHKATDELGVINYNNSGIDCFRVTMS